MFGFTKGDLSTVRAKTTQPLGAGPYKFVSYENGVVTFEANENYWKGEPVTKYILFQETGRFRQAQRRGFRCRHLRHHRPQLHR